MTKQKSQLDRFKEAARELETDDDEARFDEKLRKLAKKPLTGDLGSESMDEGDGS